MVTTVGELKKELEKFDDNLLLDLYAYCYDRNNYICIRRDNYEIGDNEPLEIYLYKTDNGRLRIENENSRDMELAD